MCCNKKALNVLNQYTFNQTYKKYIIIQFKGYITVIIKKRILVI